MIGAKTSILAAMGAMLDRHDELNCVFSMSRPGYPWTRCARGTAQVPTTCAVTRSVYARKHDSLRSMRCYTSARPKAPAGRGDKDTPQGSMFWDTVLLFLIMWWGTSSLKAYQN
jgi:hypothetical protein